MAEFQWWLLLVGLVAGGGLVAVVFLDGARREQDIDEAELPAEARWIADRLAMRGLGVDADDAEAVLREHREYRQLPPPDRFEPVVDGAVPVAAAPASRMVAPDEAPAVPATPGSPAGGAER